MTDCSQSSTALIFRDYHAPTVYRYIAALRAA